MDEASWKNLKSEVAILASLDSPFIIKMFDQFKTRSHFYLILEYCNGGNLENYIEQNKTLSEEEAAHVYQ